MENQNERDEIEIDQLRIIFRKLCPQLHVTVGNRRTVALI